LDGAYGAVAALEVLRTLAESGDPLAEQLEIVGFADEEGVRFESGLIGSLALVGELDIERLRDGLDWQGVPIRQVLAGAGRDLVQGVDAEAVANIGSMGFHPGGVNVIPGRAQFTLKVRHLDEPVIGEAVWAFATRLERICAEEGCRVVVELLSSVPPAPMNETVVAALEQVCRELGRRPAKLSSGAGHDAAVLSRHVPSGMLFVPSVGGLSHSPRETTSDEHLVLGARALLRGVRAVAARIK